jgi:hypothetical protein
MGFAVDRRSRLLVRSIDQAEHLPTALIKPILQVLDAVLFLRLHVCLVRVLDCICGQPLDFVMGVHVKWHCISLSVSVPTIKTHALDTSD